MPDRLLYDPVANPSGPTLEAVLEQRLAEVRVKQDRARARDDSRGARESALVVTHLEQALLWQYRRGQITGVVEIHVKPLPAAPDASRMTPADGSMTR